MISSRLPLVFVLGATGTGKSKLAIEIAKHFKGEIISADSMQVYKGLDIITNKVTVSEREEIVHHLVDNVSPLQSYTVVDFRNDALKATNKMLDKELMPVIVGGTNYYIESILWNVLVSKKVVEHTAGKEDTNECSLMFVRERKHLSNEELFKQLVEIDPEMAKVIHPNNRRKVLRSLEVYGQTGKQHSVLLKEQRTSKGGSQLGGPLRFPNACILWIHCHQDVLNERLDKRVDTMLEQGLIDELLNFHKQYNEHRLEQEKEPDYEHGIFQSIGFKEFHEYLILPPERRNNEESQSYFKQGVEALKLVTRRYSRKQIKWIQNRFLKSPDREVPPLYKLDGTNLDNWNEEVYLPAINIVKSLLNNQEPLYQPFTLEKREYERTIRNCHICNKYLEGQTQYDLHMKSSRHKRLQKKLRDYNIHNQAHTNVI